MTDPTTDEPVVDPELEEPTGEEPTGEEPDADAEPAEDEPDTFPREYVERLRKENATYRERAKERDDLARRLHTALVAQDGRLAAADELDYAEEHLTDPDALTAAIDDLLASKPYLAARKVTGAIGQGVTPATPTVDLAGIIRSRAS